MAFSNNLYAILAKPNKTTFIENKIIILVSL
jgi:hypothetical protein